MAPRLLIPFLLLAVCSAAAVAVAQAMSAYDALRSHGLPVGLLPKGVRDFRVDEEGRFEAVLDAPCTAHLETEVRYERNVSGALSYGQIASLSGVSAMELFLWLPVRAIRVFDPASGVIFFDLGGVRKQFSISLFDSPPDCAPDPEIEAWNLRRDFDRDGAARAAV